MTKVLIDDVLRAKLNGLAGEVELCDESGRTVGHFLPMDQYLKLLYAWAKAEFADEEELRQARAEPGGLTTAEAIAHLESLARSYGNKA
jgi:hypothetical protein